MCIYFAVMLCAGRIGLGWAYDEFKFACHMFMHFHAYIPSCFYHLILQLLGTFLIVSLSLSISLSCVSCFMAPKCKSTLSKNPLHSGASSPLILHLLLFSSMIREPVRTSWRISLDEAFIRNAKSSYQIFSILTFPLSFTVRAGSHCVAPRSLVPPWSYSSFTSICTDLILLYHISSLTFEVRAS